MIQLSTIHLRTIIIARPPLGKCGHPHVVSGGGCMVGHNKMLLNAWHNSGKMMVDHDQVVDPE